MDPIKALDDIIPRRCAIDDCDAWAKVRVLALFGRECLRLLAAESLAPPMIPTFRESVVLSKAAEMFNGHVSLRGCLTGVEPWLAEPEQPEGEGGGT